MKPAARFQAGALARRFARLRDEIESAALDAAADALASHVEREREREDLHAPLSRAAVARRRFVGADDSESLVRELGSPGLPPAPWLAPSLPGVRAPMRAAAISAVARAFSRFKR